MYWLPVVIATYGPMLAFILSAGITITHTAEEATADEPIWDYLARVYLGAKVGRVGLLGLIAFAGLQVLLAGMFYLGDVRHAGIALAAIRVGDLLVSHIAPWFCRYRPNPGFASAVLLYSLESVILALLLT